MNEITHFKDDINQTEMEVKRYIYCGVRTKLESQLEKDVKLR